MIKTLSASMLDEIKERAEKSRADIIAMTYLAGSGHPGGSMSSIDIYTLLYHVVDTDKDKVIVSHGHTSPGVYSALARKGLFYPKEVIKGFRRLGSIFEGHVEPTVPGVVWGTGNLGQGLSVACGYAVAARVKKEDADFFVVMGDGEQQKGQISEARRFIRKYSLNNITVIIDNNKLQISGDRNKVMPQNLKAEYEEAGFVVLEIDGHDIKQIYDAISKAVNDAAKPYAILANTVMGKGVSFMENKADYHGRPLNKEEMQKAISEIKLEWPLEELEALRKEPISGVCSAHSVPFPKVNPGKPKDYDKTVSTDNRSAMGDALADVAEANKDVAFVVFDCDLAGSVKTAKFGSKFPDRFFQAGISEHNTAVMAGAASTCGVISVFADFGMFGIDETYNQQRLNGINNAHVKLLCTHVGIDVGEDGKTHQCIDYLGLMRNTGFNVIVPIDPKETDLATRWALTNPGNCLVAMGRSKTPIITDKAGEVIVKEFVYGAAYHLRKGDMATLFSLGAMSANAIRVWEILAEKGIKIEVVGVSCPLNIEVKEIADAAKRGPVFVVEDHLEISGLANQIAYIAATNNIAIDLMPMGVKGFPPSGPSNACYKHYGLDPESIAGTIMNKIR
jgi:transketolase